MYEIPIIFALLLILTDIIFIFKRKKKRKMRLPQRIERIEKISKNEKISFMLSKIDSKKYNKTKKELRQAGLNLSVSAYEIINLIVPFVFIILSIIFNYINKINILINLEKIKEVAIKLGKPEMAEINFNLNITTLLLVGLLSYLLPNLILKILIVIRKNKGQKEVLMLQTYTIILLKAGVPTKRILIGLYNRSKIFKKELEISVNSFSTDPNNSLNKLKENVSNEGFKKIVISLKQNLNNDRKTSLVYLNNHRTLGKEINKNLRKRRNKKVGMIGILFMIVPLLALMAVGFYPWFVYMLNQVSDIPI